jgi:hypothetical protein
MAPFGKLGAGSKAVPFQSCSMLTGELSSNGSEAVLPGGQSYSHSMVPGGLEVMS